ncbi:hypothetical protein BJ322DRAFT_1210075 [Thelephora terrestris]|uniref:Uncharacterized protein n=1 Tax=Thelephora terrestris TaxID=56493 RepID=A0A9P6HI17_9AGAM|nr:hypothetical protein BJ322DRAFT_1210075 [Thelephora terrestris]
MTTTATRTPVQHPKRVSSSSPSLSPPTLSKPTLSARSAVPPRVASTVKGPVRRTSLRSATPPNPTTGANNTESKEWFATQLKQETELKEQLLLRLENKEQSILQITKDNDQLSSSLKTAESRLVELYADQRRAEDELGARIEVIEKLRSQVREIEREKREVQRRYNEQTSTFEAERQAFYDNEQHLKSRIQSLSQARRQPVLASPSIHEYDSETEPEEEEPATPVPSSTADDHDSEPPEVTALKLELSTLSTSYLSIQNTLVLLQSQLVDLKRVNQELQEENESYNILLRERTLTGQFDLSKGLNGAHSDSTDGDSVARTRDDDAGSMRSTSRSLLDPVDETPEGGDMDPSLVNGFDAPDNDSVSSSHRSGGRHARRNNTGSASQSPTRGETLADLPITGPGLDLAAELGRAENRDSYDPSGRRSRKASTADRKPSNGSGPRPEVDALRSEVKILKDANKALSLYASKILDRIIATEGFEHVLAVDYTDKAEPAPAISSSNSPPVASKKPRPQSVMVGRTVSSSSDNYPSPMMSPTERLTTFESIRAEAASSKSPPIPATVKASRRSLSFDWKGFSMFGGDKKSESSNLRPLTLTTGASSVLGVARKLDTEEDDDDRRERERLNATMKLMGIEKPVDAPTPIIERSSSSSAATPTTSAPQKFSFFRRSTVITPNNNTEQSSMKSVSSNSPRLEGSNPNLTQEALEQAEVEGKIAQLDARERSLSMELANGSGSGFTEMRMSSRRGRRSDGRSSGSTIWSAGLSQGTQDE